MEVDLRNVGNEDDCEDMKEVASKVGVQVVCNDEDEKGLQSETGINLSDSPECDNMKEVASKVGVQVVCDDDE